MLQRADERLGGRLPLVPDRTLVAAVEIVRSTDDALVADYLGGVLAASGEDDSGTPIVQLIGQLSSRDLRAHFVLYRDYQRLIPDTVRAEQDTTHVYVRLDELVSGLGVGSDTKGVAAADASLVTLVNEAYLAKCCTTGTNGSPAEGFILGDTDKIGRWFGTVRFPSPGLVVAPSPFGAAFLV